jgi:hypothetical protein
MLKLLADFFRVAPRKKERSDELIRGLQEVFSWVFSCHGASKYGLFRFFRLFRAFVLSWLRPLRASSPLTGARDHGRSDTASWLPATDTLADLARKFGHDGLVVRNVRDSIEGGPLGTTYAALRPGTVTSPLTGAPIYSLLAALAGQQYGANSASTGRARE